MSVQAAGLHSVPPVEIVKETTKVKQKWERRWLKAASSFVVEQFKKQTKIKQRKIYSIKTRTSPNNRNATERGVRISDACPKRPRASDLRTVRLIWICMRYETVVFYVCFVVPHHSSVPLGQSGAAPVAERQVQ